jgi:hypothetical protein
VFAKFPGSPGVEALKDLAPDTLTLAAGAALARVYSATGPHHRAWNEFRHFGPLNARWDNHLPSKDGGPVRQARGIYYAASDAKTCLAETFQSTRRIDRIFHAPWLVIFETESPLLLLNLRGEFATRMGASMDIHSGHRARARGWARDLYDAYPEIQGISYAASMHGGEPAVALNESALRAPLFPRHPLFHRALADDTLLDPLKHAARTLGYALR